jgi:hypothetical protein
MTNYGANFGRPCVWEMRDDLCVFVSPLIIERRFCCERLTAKNAKAAKKMQKVFLASLADFAV